VCEVVRCRAQQQAIVNGGPTELCANRQHGCTAGGCSATTLSGVIHCDKAATCCRTAAEFVMHGRCTTAAVERGATWDTGPASSAVCQADAVLSNTSCDIAKPLNSSRQRLQHWRCQSWHGHKGTGLKPLAAVRFPVEHAGAVGSVAAAGAALCSCNQKGCNREPRAPVHSSCSFYDALPSCCARCCCQQTCQALGYQQSRCSGSSSGTVDCWPCI
jgi:hypothetical protein